MKKSFLILLCLLSLFNLSIAQTPANDAAMYLIKLPSFSEFTTTSILGVFRNSGTDTLKSVMVNWTLNNGVIHRFVKEGIQVARNQNWPFTAPEELVLNTTGDYKIKMWVSAPNGQTDGKNSNDTLIHTIQVIEKYPPKKILIEEVTGAWCGYCPRAPIIYRETVEPVYPNTIFVAIHSGDGMAMTDSREFTNMYVTGIPCGFVDRRKLPSGGSIDFSPEEWLNLMNQTDNRFNPAILNVYDYYNAQTGEWKIDVVVDFVFNMTGNFRMNAYIVENGLFGTGSNWDQRNFFNGGAQSPYMALQGAGDPLPNYIHNHVVRKMLGGSWGQAGIIPTEVKKGDRYVFTKTFKADPKWKMENISVVGMLQLFDNDKLKRQILNTTDLRTSYKTGTDPISQQLSANIFPNPAGENAWLTLDGFNGEKIQVRIFSITGEEIITKEISNPGSAVTLPLDLAACKPGIYFVRISDGKSQKTLKLIR